MSTLVCKVCGGSFFVKASHALKRVTCSRGCMAKMYRQTMVGDQNPNHKGIPEKTCETCGGAFKPASLRATGRFCSRTCKARSPEGRLTSAANGRVGATKLRTRIGRKDNNHAAIVDALTSIGAYVYDCSGWGGGVPDILIMFRGVAIFAEIKNPDTHYGRSGLNDNQLAFVREANLRGVHVPVFYTADEAIRYVGSIGTARAAA